MMFDVGGKTFSVGVEQNSVGIVLTRDRTSVDDGRYWRGNLHVGVDQKTAFAVLINDKSLADDGKMSSRRLLCWN